MIKVLLVEDDADFREPMALFLRKIGMEVVEVDCAEKVESAMEQFSPNIFILDVNLPGKDGFSVAQRYRNQNSSRIIMLTAKTSTEDHVEGLTAGADFYLNKPIRMRELKAVIESAYRRIDLSSHHQDDLLNQWYLEPKRWVVHSPDAMDFILTHAEYRVLTLLFSELGEVVSRENLSTAIGKKLYNPRDRSIDLLISRIRKKCSSSAFPLTIQPVRGVGYRLIE